MIRMRTQNLADAVLRFKGRRKNLPKEVNRWANNTGIREVREIISNKFRNQSDGIRTWVPLSPYTVARRAEEGYGPRPILIRSGSLMQEALGKRGGRRPTVTSHGSGTKLAFSIQHGKATSLEFGSSANRTPPRPFMRFNHKDSKQIRARFSDFIKWFMRVKWR